MLKSMSLSSCNILAPLSGYSRGWCASNRNWQIADLAKADDRRCSGMDKSQYLTYFSSSKISKSLIALSLFVIDSRPFRPRSLNSADVRMNWPISYLIEQNTISVTPSCSLGSSCISGFRSLSLIFNGRLPENWCSLPKAAPAICAERKSRIRICHHKRFRISASKIETFWKSFSL